MKGNMRTWITKVAIWILVTSLIGPSRVWASAITDHDYTLGLHEYTTVSFTTESATKESYTKLIEALRHELSSDSQWYEIPVLQDAYTVADPERFLLVALRISKPGISLTLALDVVNANVVAYQVLRQSYYLTDAPALAFSDLFIRTEKKNLTFSSSYTELERVAGTGRRNIDHGIKELEAAISLLYQSSTGPVKDQDTARSLIVIIQMITEAARFRYIEQQVRFSIKADGYKTFRPDASVVALETNWIGLSKAIQESNQGAFSQSIQLQRANGLAYYVDSLSSVVKANLALLLFACRVPNPPAATTLSFSIFKANNYDNTCQKSEPKTKIIGREGLCVEVRGNDYNNDGNQVILGSCIANVFWTFKRDGTIRSSNGKCLTTYNYGPESYVMIFNCSSSPESTTRWVLDNGSIINPDSNFSLTAESASINTVLSVEQTIYASRQGWVLSSNFNAQIFQASVVGFKDLCLQWRGSAVWVEECVNGRPDQQWLIFPDGTIRPQQTRTKCLTSNLEFPGTDVIILDCASSGWSSQRWMFKNDGAIMNVRTGLVVEVKGSDPSILKLALSKPTGSPTQKWLPLL